MTAKKTTDEKIAILSIKRMKLVDLKPHPRNEAIRRHPDPGTPKWEALRKSLAHDYFDPLVHNKRNGLLVSGHLRLKVMLADGYTYADVSVVDYDEGTHLARMVAANHEIGEDIMDGLKDVLLEIDCGDMDMSITGFDIKELEELMTQVHIPEEKEPADEPEPQNECPKCGHKW